MQDKLREEQDILLEIIESWEEVLGESVAIQYLDQYVEGYCYAFNMEGLILFSEDLKVEESYIEPETFSSNLQFKYQFIPKSGQWVRKKKSPNCYSQNPDDCYIACYEETTPGYLVNHDNIEAFKLEVIPENLTKTESKRFELYIDFDIPFQQVVSKLDGKVIKVEQWEKVVCR